MKTARIMFVLSAFVLFAAAPALAETNWNLQAVDADGVSTWSGSFPFTLTGVILNNPEDMLDSTYDADAVTNGTMGAQWQLFIQGIGGDHAGTAIWIGQNYNSISPTIPAGNSYDETAWTSEMLRVNYDSTSSHQFRQGDLVTITINKSLFYGGKRNVNESHRTTSANDFTVTLVTADYGLPTAEVITISDLLVSSSVAGYDPTYPMFDQSRLTGAEYYQGAYVLLTGLTITDGSGWGQTEWGDRLCTVEDEFGNEFTLRMPLNDLGEMPTGEFSAYGIINQESGSGSNGRMGYELFVTGVVPEPACMTILAFGSIACILRRRK